jgi:hypothetical protein
VAELSGNLERAADLPSKDLVRGEAVDSLPIEEDLATIRLVEARYKVEEGGFTGSIGPYEPGNGLLFDLEAAVVYGPDAAEVLLQGSYFQHSVCSRVIFLLSRVK